jgi:hypothetical protein
VEAGHGVKYKKAAEEALRASVFGVLDDDLLGVTPSIRAHKVVTALQFALGDDVRDCPTYEALRDRLVARVAELQAKAAKWDAHEQSLAGREHELQRKVEAGEIKTPQAYLDVLKRPAPPHTHIRTCRRCGELQTGNGAMPPALCEDCAHQNAIANGANNLAPLPLAAKAEAARHLIAIGLIDRPQKYLDLLGAPESEWPRIVGESAPGLSARYPDATPAEKLRGEPITVDLSGDWD